MENRKGAVNDDLNLSDRPSRPDRLYGRGRCSRFSRSRSRVYEAINNKNFTNVRMAGAPSSSAMSSSGGSDPCLASSRRSSKCAPQHFITKEAFARRRRPQSGKPPRQGQSRELKCDIIILFHVGERKVVGNTHVAECQPDQTFRANVGPRTSISSPDTCLLPQAAPSQWGLGMMNATPRSKAFATYLFNAGHADSRISGSLSASPCILKGPVPVEQLQARSPYTPRQNATTYLSSLLLLANEVSPPTPARRR